MPNDDQNPQQRSRIERVSYAERLKRSLAERDPEIMNLPEPRLRAQTRRNFLIFGAGAALAASGFWWALPDDIRHRLGDSKAATGPGKNRILDQAIHFDDDVAEVLYSPNRLVPTFDRSRAQSPHDLVNNYNGPTPDRSYLNHWGLAVSGLASGRTERLKMSDIWELQRRFGRHDQVTQLTCVEGWRAIAWWSGLRFADFLEAFPPAPSMSWARLDSGVNLGTDDDGNPVPDPYYVSIDLPTARHPQTLLATHQSSHLLTIEHGAPLRLIAPMKLGLKNIKAITRITYCREAPRDYWYERGYSQYDGI